MDVVITEWALDSCLNLKHAYVFTQSEYQNTLRPDVELLKDGMPPKHEKFKSSKFWGPATDMGGSAMKHGYKMKWRKIGPGRVQLRLAVAHIHNAAFLCQGYVKNNELVDKREMAKFKNRIRDISNGHYVYRGNL
jgi:hypothetical protein